MDRQDGDRRNLWSDPRVILAAVSSGIGCFQAFIAVCGLFVVIAGGVLGSFIFLRTQATTSEISNATLNARLIEIKGQIDGLNQKLDDRDDDVKRISDANIRQDGRDEQFDTRIKALEEQQRTQGVYNTEVTALNKAVSALQAKER